MRDLGLVQFFDRRIRGLHIPPLRYSTFQCPSEKVKEPFGPAESFPFPLTCQFIRPCRADRQPPCGRGGTWPEAIAFEFLILVLFLALLGRPGVRKRRTNDVAHVMTSR
jgi:hypothetical protein